MGKTFDEIVQNYTDPASEWQVEVNGTDYTNYVSLIEFENEINNPLSFSVEINGVSGRNTDIAQGRELVIKFKDFPLFRGVVQEVDAGTGLQNTLKGGGYATELEADVDNHYQSTDVSTVVDDIVDTSSTATGKTFSTSYNLSGSPVSVDDFRANKTQLEEVNRLMGEYDIEWYESFDGSDEPVFNVVDQVQNDDGGSPLDTIVTSGSDQNAQVVRRNSNRNQGDFDGVIVRGYGDGDDQVTASAGSTGKGNRVLIYTDKTILSSSQAQKRANNLESSRTVYWREIRVKPATPNQLYGLGDLLRVDAEDAKLDDDYRVVGTWYKIDLVEEDVETTLTLSNKPQTFLSDFKTQEEKTSSQTDFMQGARNVWSEKETANASSVEPLTIDIYVPPDIEDLANNNRLNKIKLNYAAAPYRQSANTVKASTVESNSPGSTNTVHDSSSPSSTYNTDVSAVEVETGTQLQASTTGTTFISTAANDSGQDSNLNDSFTGNTWNTVTSFTPASGDDESAQVIISMNTQPELAAGNSGDSGEYTEQFRVTGGVRDWPDSDGVRVYEWTFYNGDLGDWTRSTKVLSIFVNEKVAGQTLSVEYQPSIDTTCDWGVQWVDFGDHRHQVNPEHEPSSGAIFSSPGADGAIGDTANVLQDGFSNTKDSTVTSFSDVTADRVSDISDSVAAGSKANEVKIYIDGVDRTNDIYGSSTSGTDKDNQLDVTQWLNTTGWHTVEIEPDTVSYLKGRLFLDHHKDST